jgi:hypothetical protein
MRLKEEGKTAVGLNHTGAVHALTSALYSDEPSLRPFYDCAKGPQYTVNVNLGGPQNPSRCDSEKKILVPVTNRTRTAKLIPSHFTY